MKVTFVESASRAQPTVYLACGVGCLVPNTDWQRVSGSCNLLKEILSLGYSGVESVVKVEFMLVSITNDAAGKATFYHDEIVLRQYRHRRAEWLEASNFRIKEFRTTPVNLNIEVVL